MTGREWKPGDVALPPWGQPAFRTRKGWTYCDGSTGNLNHDAHNLRPVVVIDPEDREQVEQVARTYCERACQGRFVLADIAVMQDVLRFLVEPPKPPEPTGLGAVVEDTACRRYVAGPGAPGGRRWTSEFGGEVRDYKYIAAVRVLSEGVLS